jgi:hypothetical protein
MIGWVSLSCQEGEHDRCTRGPEEPSRPEEIAQRCACEHHDQPHVHVWRCICGEAKHDA